MSCLCSWSSSYKLLSCHRKVKQHRVRATLLQWHPAVPRQPLAAGWPNFSAMGFVQDTSVRAAHPRFLYFGWTQQTSHRHYPMWQTLLSSSLAIMDHFTTPLLPRSPSAKPVKPVLYLESTTSWFLSPGNYCPAVCPSWWPH